MIADLLAGLARANLAAAAAILLVLLLRKPVRAAFGARVGYRLWIVVPLAALASLLPAAARTTAISPFVARASDAVGEAVPGAVSGPALAPLLLAVWIAGMAAAAALLVLRQAQFMAEVRAGRGGPAVVGALRPRIVTPADFEARFDAAERGVILAHEEVHLAAGDARINALAAAAQCACWFNPLVHLAARRMRIDQELACDAAVLGRFPTARKLYGEVLLKTQLATHPLPLGCHWPAGSPHPLKERIVMLKSPLPTSRRRLVGLVVIAGAAAAASLTAWAAQPGSAPTLITAPAWVERPNGEDIARVYPAAAKAERLSGSATIDCRIDASGLLQDCTVAAETPAGAGFGPAAVQLAPEFKMAAIDKTGVATSGNKVRIPMRFMVP